jgi:GNAT superfamily N-acetyltransferase
MIKPKGSNPMAINRKCWEILDTNDIRLTSVRKLYETTLDESERIPWDWIERGLNRRAKGKSRSKIPHLIVRESQTDETEVDGFVLGLTIPQWAGYLSYLGVNDQVRGKGIGRDLMESMIERMEFEASRQGFETPYVIWESQPPSQDDPSIDWEIWRARMRLFERIGGYWVKGLCFQSPNYIDPLADPTELELFIRPMDWSKTEIESIGLKRIAFQLYRNVYGLGASNPIVRNSLIGRSKLSLVAPSEAYQQKLILQ